MSKKKNAPLAGLVVSLSVFAATVAPTRAPAAENANPERSAAPTLLAQGRTLDATLALGGERLASTWYLPEDEGRARGWVVLFHGFARNKGNMRELATRLQKNGLIVLTPTVGLGQLNNEQFLTSAAKDLAALGKIPGTEVALPSRLVLAGHSAGGKNALFVAAAVNALDATRLAGVLLLDPVEKDGAMQRSFATLASTQVEVLSVLAKPGSCNADSNATSLLRDFHSPYKGVRFLNGTHCDAEGSSTDFLCKLACGNPAEKTVNDVQDFASNWVIGFFEGAHRVEFFPGSARYEDLVKASETATLE